MPEAILSKPSLSLCVHTDTLYIYSGTLHASNKILGYRMVQSLYKRTEDTQENKNILPLSFTIQNKMLYTFEIDLSYVRDLRAP